MPADSLSSIAAQLLEHAGDALDQADVVSAIDALNVYAPGRPNETYVSHDVPQDICQVLSVYLESLGPRLLGQQSSDKCSVVPTATFRVRLTRCVTSVGDTGMPSSETLDNEATALLIDGWALWKYLTDRWRDGTLLQGIACRSVTWGSLEPVDPEGGLAGWQLGVTVQV